MTTLCSYALGLLVMLLGQPALAAEVEARVQLVESDDSLCLAHGGQLISVRLTDLALATADAPTEVWVDRWFMQVQTADHTRHLLTAQQPEVALGCSQSIAGPQHWTLSTIKRLPAAGLPSQASP